MPFFLTSIDIIGVYDSGFDQVFQNARPLKATVRESSRPMEHPLENNQIITDYRIILPIEITLPVMITSLFYSDTYQEIKNLYLNAELLSVQTKTQLYPNMIIADLPHDESPEQFDAVPMTIRFKQVIVIAAQSDFAPTNPANSDIQQVGQQNPSGVITPTSGNFATPTGTIVSGVPGATYPNIGPAVTPSQTQYNSSGVATFPTQSGFHGASGSW